MSAFQPWHFLVFVMFVVVVIGIPITVLVLIVRRPRGSSTAQQPPNPGWYPAPDNPRVLRWFDGTRWTEHTHQQS